VFFVRLIIEGRAKMKITVKEVNGAKFELDNVTAQTNVMELKTMIEKVKGWTPATQKLVFSGKILADDKSLADYDWKDKEGAFLVCMISKKAAAPAPAAAASATPAAAPKPVAVPQPAAPTKSTSAPSSASPAAAPTPAAAPRPAPASSPLIKDSDVNALKDMGFPENEVRAALTAAFGNTDRAVEYLMNGIPPGVMEPAAAPSPAAAPRPAAAAGSPAAAAASPSDSFPLLRANPQVLNQLKVVSRDNPQALAQYIQQLKNTNPQLIEEINKNRAGFLQLLKEPVATDASGADEFDDDAMEMEGDESGFEDPTQMMQRFVQEYQSMSPEERAHAAAAMGVNPNEMQALVQMMGNLPPAALAQLAEQMQGGGGGGMRGGGGSHPHQQVVHLTQQEVDAVNRLQELGFSRQACLEAYLACDKNEELAANYLFSNPPQEDD
jgi:UV excision repair protein RAD23